MYKNVRKNLFSVGVFVLTLSVPVVMSMFVPAAYGADVLYSTGTGSGPGAGLSGLYEVDPFTGASTLIWNFQGVHIYAGGLAYDAGTDMLFATGVKDSSTGTTTLFSIDRFNGAIAEIGPVGAAFNLSSGGLAINPLTGVMYATGGAGNQSTGLFTIDKSSGTATLIGLSGGQCCTIPFGFNMNGLGFGDDGTLWANGFTLSNPDSHLFTLNLATGAATDIGSHGVSLGRQLSYSGLAFRDDGALLSLGSISASRNGLYSVDTATGLATLIGDTVVGFGADGGLTFAPGAPVPEPGTYALLLGGIGLLILVAGRGKQRL